MRRNPAVSRRSSSWIRAAERLDLRVPHRQLRRGQAHHGPAAACAQPRVVRPPESATRARSHATSADGMRRIGDGPRSTAAADSYQGDTRTGSNHPASPGGIRRTVDHGRRMISYAIAATLPGSQRLKPPKQQPSHATAIRLSTAEALAQSLQSRFLGVRSLRRAP